LEATGYSRWFERLLAALGIEVWIGDAAEIKTKRVRKAKDRPRGCPTFAEVAAGKSFSANLGTESRESRSAATAMAPVSAGADTHADYESAAGSGDERRQTMEAPTVE
jgi:transposase